MGKKHKNNLGQKLRTPVLLFMMGGTAIGTAGCTTTSDFVSRNWQKFRGDETSIADVDSSTVGPTASLGDVASREPEAKSSRVPFGIPFVSKSKAKPAAAAETAKVEEGFAQTEAKPSASETTPRVRKNYSLSLFHKQPEKGTETDDPFMAANEPSVKAPVSQPSQVNEPVEETKETVATASADDSKLSFEDLVAQISSSRTTAVASQESSEPKSSDFEAGIQAEAEAKVVEETESKREQSLEDLFAELSGQRTASEEQSEAEANPFAAIESEATQSAPEVTAPAVESTGEEAKIADAGAAVSETEKEEVISDARLQADTLLLRARIALRRDRADDALRLALAAERIEKDAKLAYGKQEERPSDFVARLHQLQTPEMAADSGTVTAETRQPAPETETVAPAETRPASLSKPAIPATPGVWTAVDAAQIRAEGGEQVARTELDGASSGIETARFESTATTGRVLANQPAQVPVAFAEEKADDAPSYLPSQGETPRKLSPETASKAKSAKSAKVTSDEKPVEKKAEDVAAGSLADTEEIASAETPYPWKLVVAFVCGGLGLLGFGLWRRMQIEHFTPRS